MPDPNQVDELRSKSIDDWNQWRMQVPPWEVNLHDADLRGFDLRGANLGEVGLRSTDFEGANLECADLHGSDLTGANLSDANLQKAGFKGASISNAAFRNSDLTKANLSGSCLDGCDFMNSILTAADLSGAKLRFIESKSSILPWLGILCRKNTAPSAVNIVLDANPITGLQLSQKSRIPYFVLLREYSGSRSFVILCFSAIAILPHALSALTWRIAGRLERILAPQAGISLDFVEVPIWKVVSGWTESPYAFVLTVFLFLYNLARAAVTIRVGDLRAEQERTGISPSKGDYWYLWRLHRYFLAWSFWISIGIAAWKIVRLLFVETVSLPM